MAKFQAKVMEEEDTESEFIAYIAPAVDKMKVQLGAIFKQEPIKPGV